MGLFYQACIITFVNILIAFEINRIFVTGKGHTSWFVGRVPPRRFEYDALNGFYSPQQAKCVCDNDIQCGGFTFKGTRSTSVSEVEVYFFHFISDQARYLTTEIEYPHWTSYIVRKRAYVVLNGRYGSYADFGLQTSNT